MKKILVTGAAGFIGYHLCEKLLTQSYEVIGLDNINDYYDVNLKYARLKELGISREESSGFHNYVSSTKWGEQFVFVRMNLEDRNELPKLFEKYRFDCVINLAAQAGVRYSLENPMAYVDSNIVGFVNILEACRHHKVTKLLYASSSSVYGNSVDVPFSTTQSVDNPISLYAATKKSNELMAYTYSHLYDIQTIGLRFFTVYGPYGRPDMAPILFASAITENRPIKVFNNGDMSRDFTYIDDIVNGIVITLNNSPKVDFEQPYYQLFNIGNGSPVSLIEFIETLEKELGQVAEKNMMPMQPGDVPRTWADVTNLNTLGYKSTTDIQKGVKKFVEWFKEYSL